MKNEIPESLIAKVQDKLVVLWAERIPQLATLKEIEEQERIMAKEIIELVLQRKETITLTKKEIRAAQEEFRRWQGSRMKSCFLDYNPGCQDEDGFPAPTPACRLCRKLTQVAEEEDD